MNFCMKLYKVFNNYCFVYSRLVVVLIRKLIVVLEFIERLFFYLYDILGFIYNF